VLSELALYRQSQMQRVRAGYVPQSATPPRAIDVGNIAVLPDDGTLVTAMNFFDLDFWQITLQPEAAGYRISAGAGALDTEAVSRGILLNPPPAGNPQNIGDDGTREVAIGFPFLFYGTSYERVFINSDGNLTFQSGDTATSPRNLSRLLAGPPRIAPYLADLDPSVAGQLSYFSSPTRFVVTWNQVPDWVSSGVGPRETFQVILTPGGTVQFTYSSINGRPMTVVGISPGGVTETPNLVDLNGTDAGALLSGAVAEIFTVNTQLDLAAVGRAFYQTHEDAYEFLAIFTTFDFDLGGAFAFEINVSNRVTGLGGAFGAAVFDFSNQFGSSRLESVLNMGNLSRYPADPAAAFFRGVDSSLSILAHEAGHRFLAYATYRDPEGSANSTGLLGRQLAHWSFLFNSDASVVEGNRIRDNGNGTFTTVGAVEHYSDVDQYLMGLRAPEEVGGTFVVKDQSSISPSQSPALNQSFTGRRADVALDQIIASSGPRNPTSVVAPKRFNFAFVLVIPRGAAPPSERVAQLERLRQAFEPYFARATSFRGTASTALTRGLRIRPNPLGMFIGTQREGTIELLAATGSGVNVNLSNSNPGAIAVPSSVFVPAGAASATFPMAAVGPGRAVIEASAPGFETSAAVVQVAPPQDANNLSLSIVEGNNQSGPPGTALPRPLRVTLRDSNQIPYPGLRIEFAVAQGSATLSPTGMDTDAQGDASVAVRLGETAGLVTIAARVPGTTLLVTFSVFALGAAQIAPGGVFNAASFAPGAAMISPGSILAIFGANFSGTTTSAQALPLPTTLANAQVSIGGILAPLFYVSPTQINAQVPWELTAPSLVPVTVSNGSSISQVTIALEAVGPGVFTRDSSGQGPGAIHHTSSPLPVSAELPAVPGEFVQIYGTGLGRVSPLPASGQAVLPPLLAVTQVPVTVTMNGVAAQVSFAGLAPGFVGLYQVNARVPEISVGGAAVVLTVNGVSSSPVTMRVGVR
jgi:uncharacterized protein (TIGR03437 family)